MKFGCNRLKKYAESVDKQRPEADKYADRGSKNHSPAGIADTAFRGGKAGGLCQHVASIV
jgi:hypothetical protein